MRLSTGDVARVEFNQLWAMIKNLSLELGTRMKEERLRRFLLLRRQDWIQVCDGSRIVIRKIFVDSNIFRFQMRFPSNRLTSHLHRLNLTSCSFKLAHDIKVDNLIILIRHDTAPRRLEKRPQKAIAQNATRNAFPFSGK